jgi:hypothetical protein
MKSILKYISQTFILLVSITSIAAAQQNNDSIPVGIPEELKVQIQRNPSSWLEQAENELILIESKLLQGYDSSFMDEDYNRLIANFELIRSDFITRGEFMRLRSLDDIKAELIQLKSQVELWRKKIARINTEISTEYNAINKIKYDSIQHNIRKDSAMWGIYSQMFNQQEAILGKIDDQCISILEKFVGIEKN